LIQAFRHNAIPFWSVMSNPFYYHNAPHNKASCRTCFVNTTHHTTKRHAEPVSASHETNGKARQSNRPWNHCPCHAELVSASHDSNGMVC